MARRTITPGKLAVAAAVVAVPLAVGGFAYAGPYDGPPATASTTSPAPGGTDTVTGAGFRPDSTVGIAIHSVAVPLASVVADANGDATATVTVPTTFAAGSSHEITLTGVDPAGVEHIDTVPIVLAGGSSSSSLPFTGFDTAAGLTVGASLVGFGGFLVFTSRRKRAAQGESAS